jgi:hypothetical protein
LHWAVGSYLGYGKKPEKARLLRGKEAEELNKAGAEALMQFMDSTKHLIGPRGPH